MLKVLRSYLVSLGYQVDMPSFNQVKRTMGDAEKMVGSFADTSIAKYAAVGVAVSAFAYTTSKALTEFTIGVANADLQNEMFARRLWMNKDAAVAYQSSLNALGASLQDLYLSPELLAKYQQLNAQAQGMGMPQGFEDTMLGVRSITFEIARLKLEAQYGFYWIGYYLTRDLAGPLGKTHLTLKDLNDWIQEHMPEWTKKVADFLSLFGQFAMAISSVGREAFKLWDSLGTGTKQVAGFGAALFAVLTTKFGPFIAGLAAILLLVNDFYTYQQGGKSAFPGMWEWLENMDESLDKSGELGKLRDDLEGVAQQAEELAKNLGKVVTSLLKLAGMKDFKKDIETFIKSGLQELSDILRTIAGSLQTINGILHLNPDEIKKGLSNTGKSLLQGSNDFNSWILGNGQATVPGGAEVPDYGTLLKNAAQNFKNRMMYGPGYESYIHPTSQNNHVQNHVEMSQTNYFYGGGDSLSLASAVGDKNSQLLTRLVRNMQGVMI